MKRRVIAQKNSLTITLPKQWVKITGTKPKDEVDIDISGRNLVIKPNPSSSNAVKEAVLKVDTEDPRFLEYILNNYYRAGYDKITLEAPLDEKKIYDLLECLLGFEITKKTKNGVVIENMTRGYEEKVDTIVKQLFFILKDDLRYLINQIKNKENIDMDHITVNSKRAMKNHNFCLRIIQSKQNEFNICYITLVNLILWMVRRVYRTAISLAELKPEKLSDEQMKFVESVQESVDDLYDGIYKKSMESLKKIHKRYRLYEEKRFDLIHDKKKYNRVVAYYFTIINRNILNSTSYAMGLIV